MLLHFRNIVSLQEFHITKSRVACFKSYSQSQNTSKDIAGRQDNHTSNNSITTNKDNEFLLVNKVICHTLYLKDLTKKLTNSVFTT
jgi:hypothetical protein